MQGKLIQSFMVAVCLAVMGFVVAVFVPNIEWEVFSPDAALAQSPEDDVEPDYNIPAKQDSTTGVEEPMAIATRHDSPAVPLAETERVGQLLNNGKWVPAIALLVTILLRMPGVRIQFKKLPQRFRILVPIILAGTAGSLVAYIDGMAISAALYTGFFGGSTASVFWHQLLFKSVAPGKPETGKG